MKLYIYIVGMLFFVQYQILAIESPEFQQSIQETTYDELISDLIKTQKELCAFNSVTLNAEELIPFKFKLDALKKTVLKVKKDISIGKRRNIDLEWSNLVICVEYLDEILLVPGRSMLEDFFEKENDTDRLSGMERMARIVVMYEVIKQMHVICELGIPSKNDNYNDLVELVAQEKHKLRIDQGESKKFVFEFKLLHSNKELDFYKKQSLIREVEKKTNKKIERLLNTRADLQVFKDALNSPFDRELKGYFRQLDLFLKKEEKQGPVLNLALEVYFKKVKERGRIGWIIDTNKTIAPNTVREDTITTLVCEPNVRFRWEPSLSGNSFVSVLNYSVDVTRGRFAPEKWTIFNENRVFGERTDMMDCEFNFKHDTKKNEIIVTFRKGGDFKAIYFWQHRYYNNADEASDLFKCKVSKLVK